MSDKCPRCGAELVNKSRYTMDYRCKSTYYPRLREWSQSDRCRRAEVVKLEAEANVLRRALAIFLNADATMSAKDAIKQAKEAEGAV